MENPAEGVGSRWVVIGPGLARHIGVAKIVNRDAIAEFVTAAAEIGRVNKTATVRVNLW